jgi:hypothetical protein
MWMPTRQPMPGSVCSEKASSISVVAASSIEKAATSARGRPSGSGGARFREAGAAREILVAGNAGSGSRAPSGWRRSGAAGARRETGFAARGFQRLGLAAVAVGLVEQLVEQRRNSGGRLKAFSSPTMRSMASAC